MVDTIRNEILRGNDPGVDYRGAFDGRPYGLPSNLLSARSELVYVNFGEISDDLVAQIVVGEYDLTLRLTLVMLNMKLLTENAFSCKIRELIEANVPDVVEHADMLGWDLAMLILRFAGRSADYGHLDPSRNQKLYVHDFAKSWATEAIWWAVDGELLDLLEANVATEQVVGVDA